jgi:hypothetical protein
VASFNLTSQEDKDLRKEILTKFAEQQSVENLKNIEARRIQKIVHEKGIKYLNTVPYDKKKLNIVKDIADEHCIEDGTRLLMETEEVVVAKQMVYDVVAQIASRERALSNKEAFLDAVYDWDLEGKKGKYPQPKAFKIKTEYAERFK